MRTSAMSLEELSAGKALADYLRAAGFGDIQSETLELQPPAGCVLGKRP